MCHALGHPVLSQDAIANLTQQLDATYKNVAEHFAENSSVRIDHAGKYPTLTITNLDNLEEPPSLTLLSKTVTGLLPPIDLTELLLESHAHTGFADYGALHDLARGCAHPQRIEQHWDMEYDLYASGFGPYAGRINGD